MKLLDFARGCANGRWRRCFILFAAMVLLGLVEVKCLTLKAS